MEYKEYKAQKAQKASQVNGWTENIEKYEIRDYANKKELIGYAVYDYFPQDETKDKIAKYLISPMDIDNYLSFLVGKSITRLDLIEYNNLAEELYSFFVVDLKEIWVQYGCCAVKLDYIKKNGLKGCENIAKLTHCGTANMQRKRAKEFYELLIREDAIKEEFK